MARDPLHHHGTNESNHEDLVEWTPPHLEKNKTNNLESFGWRGFLFFAWTPKTTKHRDFLYMNTNMIHIHIHTYIYIYTLLIDVFCLKYKYIYMYSSYVWKKHLLKLMLQTWNLGAWCWDRWATHLKHMRNRQFGFISLRTRGENSKNVWKHNIAIVDGEKKSPQKTGVFNRFLKTISQTNILRSTPSLTKNTRILVVTIASWVEGISKTFCWWREIQWRSSFGWWRQLPFVFSVFSSPICLA